MIYYTKTVKPHERMESMCGPVYSFETALHELHRHVGRENGLGGKAELDRRYRDEGQNIGSIIVPVAGGKLVTVTLMRETAPEIISSVPRETYRVVRATDIAQLQTSPMKADRPL